MLVGDEAMNFLSTDFGMDDGDDEDEDEDGMGSKAMRHLALQHTEEVQRSTVQYITVQCSREQYSIQHSSLIAYMGWCSLSAIKIMVQPVCLHCPVIRLKITADISIN